MLATDRVRREPLRPFTRKEYDRLVEEGLFDDEKVELLYGLVVQMTPQGTGHSFALRKLTMLLAPALLGRADVQLQLPFAASEDSEPEPDLSVVPVGDYLDDHPGTAYLAIEVALSSLTKDRDVKSRLYAEADIPEYWIVNLKESVVEVRTKPSKGRYRSLRRFKKGQSITLTAFDDVTIAVRDFLP